MHAHSPLELHRKPTLTKTRYCKLFLRSGSCEYPNCSFAHSSDEVKNSNTFFKSKLCVYYMNCKVGSKCRYAHSLDDIRAPCLKSDCDTAKGFPLVRGDSFTSTRGSFSSLARDVYLD
jgi:Zinc finger C-x8-C-x5-C-x3-H type (and similar)